MKYKIRATSLQVYEEIIDTNDYPEVFDEQCNLLTGIDISEACDTAFPYGAQPIETDWEFTNLEPFDREQNFLNDHIEIIHIK